MIVGWVEQTAGGFRLYRSRQGRYFRDVVSARSRESVVSYHNQRRSAGGWRRTSYYIGRQHLRGQNVAVRMRDWDSDGAA